MPEQQKVQVNSIPALLEFMGNVIDGKANWDDIDIDKLHVVIPVEVEGESWEERFDNRGAALVCDLQKHIRKEYTHVTSDRLSRKVLVKATSKKGCNLLDLDLTEVLKTAVTNMPPEYVLSFVCLAILGWAGNNFYKHYVDKCGVKEQAETLQKAVEAMKEVSIQAINSGNDITASMRSYLRKLDADDLISVAGSDFTKKKDAYNALPKPTHDDRLYYTACDGEYSLLSLDLEDALPVLGIAQDNNRIKAMFVERVPQDVKDIIITAVEDSIESQTPKQMYLHVDCYFTTKTRKYCVIVGIGEPREGLVHYKLENIPDTVTAKDMKLPGLS